MPRGRQVDRQRRAAGPRGRFRSQSLSAAPIWKSAPSGPGDILGDELLERLATDPSDYFAHEVPVVERVVAGRGARLTTRAPEPPSGRWPAPSRRGPRPKRAGSRPDTPEACDMTCRTRTSCLPWAANSGQYFRDRLVQSSSPRSTSISAARLGHRLGGGPGVGDGVLIPRDRPGLVAEAAPDVDDAVAVDVHHDRRAEFLARVHVPGQPRCAPPRTARRIARECLPFSSSSPLRPVLALRMAANKASREIRTCRRISVSACCRRRHRRGLGRGSTPPEPTRHPA